MRFNINKLAQAVGMLALLISLSATAQDSVASNMDSLRDEIRADKKLVVASNLILTDSQAAKFWPIYDGYQADLAEFNERLGRLIVEYGDAYGRRSLTDSTADRLIREAIDIEQDEVARKKKLAKQLDGVIPPIEAARYLQIESKIRAIIRFDIAASVPLAD